MTSLRLWVGMTVLVSGSLLAWIVRYGTAVVLDGFRADFHTDAAALGALAAAYFWPYALMQPFAGLLCDWWGPRRALTVWLAVAGVGTVVFALAPTYWVALVGRALSGAGVGIVLVAAFSLLARWFGPRYFGTLTGLYAATGPLGGLLAAHPLAALADLLGWRLAFGTIAAWLLLTALGAFLAIPELRSRDTTSTFRAACSSLWQASRLRNLWLCSVYAAVALGILSAMQGLWTVPFLAETYGLDRTSATGVLQAWSIGLLIALPAWGYLVDRVTHSHKWTMVASIALQAAAWLLLSLKPTIWPADTLFPLFLFLALMNGCWMPAYALVHRTTPAAMRASALGLLNLSFFLGAAGFQWASGIILGRGPFAAPSTDDYTFLFGLFVVALGLAALALAAAREPGK